jgi:hypothetical protein
MSTKRSPNKVTERSGIAFVQSIVEKANCIFEHISLENDVGNDCFIEFFTDNIATSFCVFSQIKSGISYKDNKGYYLPTDNDHIEYWANHLMPVIGIVYDPEMAKAFWINITEYIKARPTILTQKHHSIRIELNNEFSDEKFYIFKSHCVNYIQEYKSYENYGRSLEEFALVDNPTKCREALKSLYSNHRNKSSTLFAMVSNFAKIKEKGIQFNILALLSNLTDNPYVFWHSGNIEHLPTQEKQSQLAVLLNTYFKEKEVESAINFLRDGVSRGDITFRIVLLLDMMDEIHVILKKLAFDENINIEERNFRIWLYIHFSQLRTKKDTLKSINDYMSLYPDNEERDSIIAMKEAIERDDFIQFG